MVKQETNTMTESEQIKKGLYTPQLEKDSCGVGLYANIDNIPKHEILTNALTMLENMEHRGACGCEENTGDGAGVLTQIPDELFRKESDLFTQKLPPKGKYGVGVFFLPKDKNAQTHCLAVIEAQTTALGFEVIHQRKVITNNEKIGKSALSTEPNILQTFFKKKDLNNNDDNNNLEKQFYFLRSFISKKVYETYPQLVDDFYIVSLSSKTIVYKGMLKATQLRQYYEDLQNPNFKTAVALVHSRFSTNTFPKWKLAQPFHCIAHNGEINTLKGNLNWWKTREKHIEHIAQNQPELSKLFPVCDAHISDSGNFNNVVNFLLQTNRSIPQIMMMMIPEAWQNDDAMPTNKKAFYQYHDSIMEAWDGPASICFTDGTIIGATLDRNGLRPSRYTITKDNHLIIASEAGCIEIPPHLIAKKGKLKPGKLLVADLEKKCIISDEDVKNEICTQKPYATWLQNHTIPLKDLATQKVDFPLNMPLQQKQISVGFSKEDSKLIVAAMLKNGKEAIGSMGSDIPLAILSKKHQHLSHYFKQQFAQVTNPPIDPLREQYYMSLTTTIGAKSKIIDIDETQAKVIECTSPIITEQQLVNLLNTQKSDFEACTLYSTFPETASLRAALDAICQTALTQIKKGKRIICLSDRTADKNNIAIPSLLTVSTLHHFLIDKGLRKEITLIVDASDIWETHHVASLLSYGVDLICPYLAYKSIDYLSEIQQISQEKAQKNYIKALEKGLLKIMSKLGISTLSSYKGAQTFEALGISQEVVDYAFKGTITRIGGLSFDDIQKETTLKHLTAFEQKTARLTDNGIYSWRKTGEYHLFNPTTIHLLQYASKSNKYEVYQKFAKAIDNLEVNSSTLRSHLRIKKDKKVKSIPIEEVESIENILKRFATGAMSFGSLSWEAHTTLAIAMNRIGAKSNSGEGGEDDSRYTPLPNGDQQHSAIKQVASGRFGVNINYLSNATELQIKIAQGAKPGEGGQLPGHKVNEHIAKVRNATPNVGLISPPPHHDIYSIEDLAQLIFDLKNANRAARISVKLVSKTGIGVIAAGVAKAHADHILISGYDGGTGASPLSSIRHAGLPWEMGLSETHQTLVKNGLRDRVVLQADGQIRTGRDLAVATMLGAEEWGIATAALVVEGCILMRKCHLNTCPVGIATQDKTLREKFEGKVEHLVNYFRFLAQHLREIMASVGVKTVNELVGRTDLLEIQTQDHYKSKNLQLAALLHQEHHPNNQTLYGSTQQNHGLESILDQTLLQHSLDALNNGKTLEATFPIKNIHRTVGTLLSNEITKRYGAKGMKTGSLHFTFKGSAGQSFGAFGAKGLLFNLEGEANDYFGKGLSGATLSVRPDKNVIYESHKNVIVGNVALYGATSGEAFINGIAGDRFGVRNSGAKVVVEGLGDNGCEYMTGGTVVVLGEIGRNFGAGMSGGIAYLYDTSPTTHAFINQEMVHLETPNTEDLELIKHLLNKHIYHTQSPLANDILQNWRTNGKRFLKIYPIEYKRAVEQQQVKKIALSQ